MLSPQLEQRVWRPAGLVLAVLVILIGAGQAWGALTEQTESEPTQVLGPISALDLDLDDASARISPGAEGQVGIQQNLDWTFRRPVVEQTLIGRLLRIKVRCPSILGVGEPTCSVALSINVPRATAVTVRLSSGSAKVSGLSGELSLRSSSGSIELDGDSGRISAHSTSGQIQGQGLTSQDVETTLTSGQLSLGFTAPPARVAVSATSGEADLTVPPGSTYRVTTHTASGGGVDRDPGLDDPQSSRSITVSTTSGHASLAYSSTG
ncbi:DUF4097 family beta strand repeat-containing protein [Kitasatospora sp. NPDC052896]|uniref:DUF4097 family beta strand repeat-containing protein n=1 Tax=Kitasatospora sp. NPDC052896 TaxID=3364061 RepID=UPI0037CBF39F